MEVCLRRDWVVFLGKRNDPFKTLIFPFSAEKASSKTKKESTKQTTSTKRDKKKKKAKKSTGKKKTTTKDKAKKTSKTKKTTFKGKVNINKASAEELAVLDGIGEERAKKIIQYRKKHGKFKNPEDIMNVDGIGEIIYNNNKRNIKVK